MVNRSMVWVVFVVFWFGGCVGSFSGSSPEREVVVSGLERPTVGLLVGAGVACVDDGDCAEGQRCMDWHALDGDHRTCEVPCRGINSVLDCPQGTACTPSSGSPQACRVARGARVAETALITPVQAQAIRAADQWLLEVAQQQGMSGEVYLQSAVTVMDRSEFVEVIYRREIEGRVEVLATCIYDVARGKVTTLKFFP